MPLVLAVQLLVCTTAPELLPDGTEIAPLGIYRAEAESDEITNLPGVLWIEEDEPLELADRIPDDPCYCHEWHLWQIQAPGAWQITMGDPNVIVAVLDSGVDINHPDLAEQLVPGWNTWDDNADTHDVTGHGTVVAGIVAAQTDNAMGVASVGWRCRIMPIRITSPTGCCYVSEVAEGLVWAADHGARVANIGTPAQHSPTVQAAATYFQDVAGGVVTVPSGNDGVQDNRPNSLVMLCVTATDLADEVCYWATTGSIVDLAAPGQGIQSVGRNGDYPFGTGTSFASPIVASTAALMFAMNPDLPPWRVRNLLCATADDLGAPGYDLDYGWGRVNAYRAVQAAIDWSYEPSGPFPEH